MEKGVRKEVGSAMEKDGGGTDADVDVEEAVERIKERLIERLGKDAGWVQGYMHAGELDLKEGLLVESEGNEMEEEVVKRVLGELKSEREDEEGKEEWHELVIPVDLPFIHVRCLPLLFSPLKRSYVDLYLILAFTDPMRDPAPARF